MNYADPKPATATSEPSVATPSAADQRWLRAGYFFIGLFFLSRLVYLASGRIELSEDEAYQWLWSKHLALSYYSKPPLIAYTQFLGTRIWGDTEFGIRFFSPVFAASLSLALLRFLAAEVNARAGFWLVVILAATPMLAVGSTLLTIDAPSVLFWVLAMVAGWRAVQTGRIRDWCWTGLWFGLGLLSKYTAVGEILSLLLFLAWWAPAREHLRRPGPYVALSIALLAFVPVLVWNSQHGWVTLTHLKERGGLDHAWKFQPRFLGEFLGGELGLLNPVFFLAMVWAVGSFWREPARGHSWPQQAGSSSVVGALGCRRESSDVAAGRHVRAPGLMLYLFCMGFPLFAFYLLYTLRGRVQLNWIAPSIVPLFTLMVVYWSGRAETNPRPVKHWLTVGLVLGFTAVALLHATELIGVLTGRPLRADHDPLHRVRGWTEIAGMFEQERQKALNLGKPAFFITHDYDVAGILSFYVPAAKRGVPAAPLVYSVRTTRPENQFYFWPGYQQRAGESAIYIQETDDPVAPPETVLEDFARVTNLGMRDAYYAGQPFRRYQLYLCEGLGEKKTPAGASAQASAANQAR